MSFYSKFANGLGSGIVPKDKTCAVAIEIAGSSNRPARSARANTKPSGCTVNHLKFANSLRLRNCTRGHHLYCRR